MSSARARVCIIGAGAAGLSLAYALSSSGIELLICDARKAGQGAIAASAGMIAPDVEASETLDPSNARHCTFHALARHSATLWPQWVSRLETQTGIKLDYRRCGAVVPGGDMARLARIQAAAEGFSIPVQKAAAGLDVPGLHAGLVFPGEARLDPRALAQALGVAARGAGVQMIEDAPVAALVEAGGRIAGVRFADGREIEADSVVIAAGWAAASLHPSAGGLQPVKGQALLFEPTRDISQWPLIRGDGVYVVPRAGGRALVGASVEPGRSDLHTDAATRDQLLERAGALLPELADWRLVEHWAGVRPALPDRMPRLGAVMPGLHVAIGAHRHGVLLAPGVAEALAREIAGQGRSDMLAAFAPDHG